MSETKTTAPPAKVSWNDQKTQLKAKFSTLTDSDLRYEDGKKDEMMQKLQTKVGKTKEELDSIIAGFKA